MKRRSFLQIGIVLTFLASFATAASAKRCLVQEDKGYGGGGSIAADPSSPRVWSTRVPLPPAGSLTVENVQGDITVEAWDRAEVEVAVVKTATGPSANPDDAQVEVESQDRSVTLRTIYPKPSEDPVRVDYLLRVPRQVHLDRLQTVDGSIIVRAVEGTVNAHTLNGNIEQRGVSGSVVARAMNGNILVALRALPDRKGSVRMDTVSGHLVLVLPPHADADLQLSTVSGRIDSNYALAVSEVPGDSSRRARVGQGGVPIRLRTVRGNIRVVASEELL
ncbi:MAG: DUF4097 domain-containing protein [Terriglobia bacterium]